MLWIKLCHMNQSGLLRCRRGLLRSRCHTEDVSVTQIAVFAVRGFREDTRRVSDNCDDRLSREERGTFEQNPAL